MSIIFFRYYIKLDLIFLFIQRCLANRCFRLKLIFRASTKWKRDLFIQKGDDRKGNNNSKSFEGSSCRICFDKYHELITGLRPRNRDCFFPAQVQNATNHWHGAKCRAFYSIASSLQERDVFVANEGVNLIASVILRVHSAATPQRVLVTRILCRWLAQEQTDRGSSKPGNINIYRLPKWPGVHHHSNIEIDFLFFSFFFLEFFTIRL